MKTLTNQTLLYDEDCPLCRLYSKGFITAGMLDEHGKKPYCQLSDEEQDFIDVKRASNEIALVDTKNKTVIYGIDSLLKVIGYSFPWIEKVGNLKPVYYFLKKLYKFISYNRKVIIPSEIHPEIKLQCIPDFNYKYRLFYIAFAWIVSSITAYSYLKILALEYSNFGWICLGLLFQIPLQILFLLKFKKEIIIDYIGNVMTISLFGSLTLTPIIFYNLFTNSNVNLNLIYFGITIFAVIYEHYRRVSILQLPKYIVFPWVLLFGFFIYRLL